MQALYRKYRSTTLDEVVGQEHVTTTLKRALKNGTISHAYLFTGPKGVGKTSTARILAHEINNLPYTSEDFNIDIIEIDAASNRRIDEIRDIRDKVAIAPTLAKYKVYIIDEVHMLTKEAFNALLKTLEEPPKHVVFILATTELHKLPETIISRTQRFHFKPISKKAIISHLKHIAKEEKITIDLTALEIIAEHSEGSFRDAINLLDQVSKYADNVTSETVEDVLGIAPKSILDTLLHAIDQKNINQMLQSLESLTDAGTPAPTVAVSLSRLLKELIISNTNKSNSSEILELIHSLLEVPSAYDSVLKLETLLIGFGTKAREHHGSKDVAIPSVSTTEHTVFTKTPKKDKNTSSKIDSTIAEQTPNKAEVKENMTIPPATQHKTKESRLDLPKTSPSSESTSRDEIVLLSERDTPIGVLREEIELDRSNSGSEATGILGKLSRENPPTTNDLLTVWQYVLKNIKLHNNTLYGVLRLADVKTTDENKIVLAFRFALHAKKANTNEVKEIIATSLQNTAYSDYTLVVIIDKEAKATLPDSITSVTIKEQKAEKSPEVPKNITDIFGGGEVM